MKGLELVFDLFTFQVTKFEKQNVMEVRTV